ncbi:MAG: hypothetical protein FWD25_02235 [Clostridia bacterium]|nr:hypothetical protein [Clostridia bacterium]
MRKLDRLLHKMRPAPADMFRLKYNLDILTDDELQWLNDYCKNSTAGNIGSQQEQLYYKSLMEKARKAAGSNGTS